MLTLLTYPGSANTFSFSPYCVKAALLLCFADVTWRRKDKTDPRSMPHQKLPVLKTEQKLVPDSDGIRTWLEQKGTDFDPGLTASERAQSRALIRMAEEHLYFHVVQDRWADDRVWPILRSRFFCFRTGAYPQAGRTQDPKIGSEWFIFSGSFPFFKHRKT